MRYCFFLLVTCSIPVFAGLDDGLVGWWKLDEGSSTTSIDSSGYNQTLSLQNGTSWTAGQINHGVQLDGVDDKLSSPSILVEGNFSVSLWVNPQSSTFLGTESNSVNNSIDPLNRTLIKPLHGGSSSFGLGLSVGTNGVSALLHASGIYCQPLVYTSAISSWVHLALILKNQQPILFVNGALVKTGLVLGRPTKLSVSAGSPIGKGYEEEDHYQGGVDELRMYDRALSSAEVFHLYALPFDLNSNSPLTLTENSPAGTIVGEFNATDPNGDNVSYALMPALPNVFSPVLWLDANDSSTLIESGGAVSAWQDKSGNDYHFTQNVDNSKCPLYSATSLNGMPSITFDGSNDYLSISSRLGFSANPDISVFAVTSFLSLADNDERIGSNSHGLAVTGGTGSWCWRFNGGHERYNDVTINNVAQQAWVRQAGTNYQASRFFYNGLEQARVAGSSDASSPTNVAEIASIGKSTTGSNFANVKISELIVLNDSSEASRRGVETYLARKWGLTYTQPTSDGIFEVESNGTLKSLVSLDRETVSSLPITVRATDPNGNFIEEDFSVTVVDDGLEDTDSDGFLDSVEYQEGSDPISNASIPGLEYGLTAWYPFDGNASDMSGNNRHATAVNSHSYISAKVGSGVRIVGSSSGVTGHVSLPYITSLENSDYTFAFWVLEESMLYAHGEDYLFYGQLERVSNRDDGVAFPFSSTTDYISGINRSSWNHYAVTKSGSTNRGYLNGSLVATGSWTSPSAVSGTATHSALGRHWWSGGASSTRLVAVFDDLRIYDRSISGTEASLLYQLPASDVDGDGYSYAEELEAGTNPNSSLSKPSLMDGLLLWYPLDGNTSDMSGNDRHATLSNANGSTSGFVNGKILKALDLDGVDDYLSVPHDSVLDLRRTLSLTMWLKLDAIPSTGYSTIMYKGGGSGGSSRTYSLWLENSSRFFHGTSADVTDQESSNSANSAFTNNSWMHLVMLLDRYNGSIQVFKDKALVANNTVRSTNTVSSQNPLLFGKSQESNSDFSDINGQMDDIRLYDRVLHSFEIDDLYDAVATDTDSDGLNDAEEMLLDTNLTSSDTDGDGLTDFEEVMGYHTYEQINSSLTWSAAKADAESRGGYLATITSLEEKNKVDTIRSSNSWLGGSDTQTEGTWQWV
ncbi:hypothetical protein N9408_03345, partial [Opitutales bacterium]|nr:hypothetical protein [Opitutales bacterium]